MQTLHITVLSLCLGFFVYLSGNAFEMLVFSPKKIADEKIGYPFPPQFIEGILWIMIFCTTFAVYSLAMYGKLFGRMANVMMVIMVCPLIVWHPICGFYIRLTKKQRKGYAVPIVYAILISAGVGLCLFLGLMEIP